MISSHEIKPQTKVICSNYVLLGVVDQVDGSGAIKLKRDDAGRHHFIPLEWVTSVDDQVHISLSSDQAVDAWMAAPREDAAHGQSARMTTDEHRIH